MRIEEFTESAPGKLVKNLDGNWTFVPNPLPPTINSSVEILGSLSEASLSLGRLAEAGRGLPNPHLLIGPLQRREAIISSRIEGTIATAQELLLFEVDPVPRPANPDVREVANHVRALEHGLALLPKLPMSLRLLREIHRVLLTGVRGKDKQPGEFRTLQNYIGKEGQPIEQARYVPPAPDQMQAALVSFEKYLHSPASAPFLIDLALTHYQFEAIHPFRDGNGRVGRLLISLLLCERKLMDQPFLYMSPFFERHRNDYQDLMLRVSQRGEWQEWILFFLRGVTEQSRDGILRARRLSDLWRSYRDRLQTVRTSALLLQLVDQLFAYPAISIKQASHRLKVHYPSAQAYVAKLVEAGILREFTGKRRGRIFVAPEIIEIIETEDLSE